MYPVAQDHHSRVPYMVFMPPSRFRSAFSLVELSVVLVILGLLTGGVLVGRSLIRSTELHTVTTDLQNYQKAIETFYERYNALPGDMPNATDIWGIAGGSTGNDPTCWTVDSSTLSNPKLTCNGSGNFSIAGMSGYSSSSLVYWAERFRAWQHLSNAELISGTFSGVTNSTSENFVVTAGKNAPATPLANTAFTLVGITPEHMATAAQMYVMDYFIYGHYLELRSINGAPPPLTPVDAQMIDSKIDDGWPITGKVISTKSSYATYAGCTTTDDTNSRYNVANNSYICHIDYYVMP